MITHLTPRMTAVVNRVGKGVFLFDSLFAIFMNITLYSPSALEFKSHAFHLGSDTWSRHASLPFRKLTFLSEKMLKTVGGIYSIEVAAGLEEG